MRPHRTLCAALLGLALAGPGLAAEPEAKAPPLAQTMGFTPKTYVDGPVLQVIFGERALIRLDDGGLPVLDSVEKGQLAAAHPEGTVAETFAKPGPEVIAVALDGSAEKQASFLKIWNGTSHPIEYRAIVLALHGDSLKALPVSTCPVPSRQVRIESWPAPIAAVGLSRFKAASKEALARPACKKGK